MAVGPTPVILPCLLSLAAAPSFWGQKRTRANTADGEADNKDTIASGNGVPPTSNASGPVEDNLRPLYGSTGQEEPDLPTYLTRDEAITTFMGSPILSEPDQLRVDHISALLALAVDGPIQKTAIQFLAPEYSQKAAEASGQGGHPTSPHPPTTL
jgi:hypothetical protein